MKIGSVTLYWSPKKKHDDQVPLKVGDKTIYVRGELFEGANMLKALELSHARRDEGIVGAFFLHDE